MACVTRAIVADEIARIVVIFVWAVFALGIVFLMAITAEKLVILTSKADGRIDDTGIRAFERTEKAAHTITLLPAWGRIRGWCPNSEAGGCGTARRTDLARR